MEFTTMGVSYGTGIGRDSTAGCHKWGKGKLTGLSAEKLEEKNATVTRKLINYQPMNQREQNQNYLQNMWLD